MLSESRSPPPLTQQVSIKANLKGKYKFHHILLLRIYQILLQLTHLIKIELQKKDTLYYMKQVQVNF